MVTLVAPASVVARGSVVESGSVVAPAALLLDRELSATAKLLWLASRLDARPGARPLRTPGDLPPASRRVTCLLAPRTIRKGLAELTAAGWNTGGGIYPASPNRATWCGRTVSFPPQLLMERHIGVQAKLLYGMLQLTAHFKGRRTRLTYSKLGTQAQVSRNTLKQAVQELAETGWLRCSRPKPYAASHFVLDNPVLYQQRREVTLAKRRLTRAKYKGEALMREFLSLLVDSSEFTDDAYPGFLVNPLTGERLQFDRYYWPEVAFEFHGAQHFGATAKFPDTEEAKEQQIRDLLKAGICVYRGISLVVITAEDLSLEGMQRKVSLLLPRRDLAGHELLVDYLERRCWYYRKEALGDAGG